MESKINEKGCRSGKRKKMEWVAAFKSFGVPQGTLRKHELRLYTTLDSNNKYLGRYNK